MGGEDGADVRFFVVSFGVMSTTQSFRTQIQQLIATDALTEAVVLLQELFKHSPKLDEAILQSAR